mmetsp:Transcript_16137/g.43767  ORF Transcript_16137/g.43767 Transcript_16137/m.43767 type:complete len:149 (+) Transcript_16137:285-731(+)
MSCPDRIYISWWILVDPILQGRKEQTERRPPVCCSQRKHPPTCDPEKKKAGNIAATSCPASFRNDVLSIITGRLGLLVPNTMTSEGGPCRHVTALDVQLLLNNNSKSLRTLRRDRKLGRFGMGGRGRLVHSRPVHSHAPPVSLPARRD